MDFLPLPNCLGGPAKHTQREESQFWFQGWRQMAGVILGEPDGIKASELKMLVQDPQLSHTAELQSPVLAPTSCFPSFLPQLRVHFMPDPGLTHSRCAGES